MEENQGYLFYENAYDALTKTINQSNIPQKEIACAIYPGCEMSTAKSRFSRAMSPESDVKLHLENIITILKMAGASDFIFYLCDEFGFERPQRKAKKDVRRELEVQIKEINKNLTVLIKRLPDLQD